MNRKILKVIYSGKEDNALDTSIISCLDKYNFKKIVERYDFLDKERTLEFEKR